MSKYKGHIMFIDISSTSPNRHIVDIQECILYTCKEHRSMEQCNIKLNYTNRTNKK